MDITNSSSYEYRAKQLRDQALRSDSKPTQDRPVSTENTVKSSINVESGTLPNQAQTESESSQNQTILKALNASGLPLTERNRALVNELLNNKLPIDKQTLQLLIKLANMNREASPLTLVMLFKNKLPITAANIRQFEAYQNGSNQLLSGIQELINNIGEALRQAAAQQGPDAQPIKDAVNTPSTAQDTGLISNEVPVTDGSADASTSSTMASSADASTGSAMATSAGASSASTMATSADASTGSAMATSADASAGSAMATPADASIGSAITTPTDASTGSAMATSADASTGSAMATSADASTGSAMATSADASNSSDMSTPADASTGSAMATSADASNSSAMATSADAYTGSATASSADTSYIASNSSAIDTSPANQSITVATKQDFTSLLDTLKDMVKRGLKEELLPTEQAISTASLESLQELEHGLEQLLHRKWTITPEQLSKKAPLTELYKRLEEDLKQLDSLFKLQQESKEILQGKESVRNIQDNLQFMKDLNAMFSYVQLPLQFRDRDVHGEFYVFNKKNALHDKKDIQSVLLHLNMSELGPINIHIKLNQDQIQATFSIENPEAGKIVSEHLPELKSALERKGYRLQTRVEQPKQKRDFIKDILERDALDGPIQRFSFDTRA